MVVDLLGQSLSIGQSVLYAHDHDMKVGIVTRIKGDFVILAETIWRKADNVIIYGSKNYRNSKTGANLYSV